MSLKRNPLIFTPRPLAAGLGVVALTAGGMLLSPVVISPAVAENTPISSPGSYQGYKTVSGQVFVDRSGPRGELDGKQSWTAYDDSDVPLSGVKVYAQWVDDDSAKTVSPIYTSTSGDDGKYSISLPDWTDSLGNKHAFKANSTQKLRIWSENPDDSKYISSFSEGFQTFANSVQRVHGFWNSLPSSRNAVDFNVSFQERPQNDVMHLPEDKQTNLTPTKTGGDVLGTVWWDQRNNYGASGDIPGLDPAWGDKPIEGMKVRASYVQDEVARQFDKWLADNKGATLDQFRDAQKQIMKQYEADNPGKSAIAETAYALTKADGSYQIQFQGLWGDSYNYKGIVNKNKYGELAPVGQGSWAKGNLSSKHVNTKYMYVSPELPEGIGGSLDTMQTNMYQDAGRNDLYVDSNALSGVTSMDFALKQENRKFDVVEYDSTDKLAKPADTANTEASGFNPGLDYDVVWTDSAGNQVGKCTVTSSNVGKIESCPFTVPDDLDQAQIYTATIYPKGDTTTALAADNFAATPEPQYKPIEVEAGGSDTVPVPVTKAGKPLHEGTTFAAPNAQELPEGIEAGPDWATVNADGSISLAPGADVKPGEYKVPVKITYPNGQSRIIEAPVTVKEKSKTADVVDPSYGDGVSVKAGESGSVSVPKGADGSALPEGSKFGPGDGVPGWVTVNGDGSLSVEPGADVEPGDYKVPVVVTYPDGSSDTVSVPVKVGPADKKDDPEEPHNISDQIEPVYPPVVGDVASEKPAFEDKNGNKTDKPVADSGQDEVKFEPGDSAPDGAKVDPSSGVVTIVDAPAKGEDPVTVPVVVTYPDGSSDEAEVVFKPEPETVTPKPAWDPVAIEAGQEVTLPNKGGNATGATVETDGPGTAQMDTHGSIKVLAEQDAKPNQTITVTVKDGKGKTIAKLELPIKNKAKTGRPVGTEPQQKPNRDEDAPDADSVVRRPGLATTGTAAAGYGAASLALLLAGAGAIAYARKRKQK